MQMMRFEALDDTHAVRKMMCLSLKCTRVTQLLLLLVSWFQQKDISFDSYCFLLIGLHHCGGLLSAVSRYHKLIELLISLQVQRSSTAEALYACISCFTSLCCFRFSSRYVSAYWITKQQEKVHTKSKEAECSSLDGVDCELYWFSYLLRDLHIQLVSSVGLFSGNKAALVFDELQWQHNFPSFSQQGLSQDFAFTDHMIVAGYAWFRCILGLLYCSLPRPPEVP
ncbi:hypothetical protein YC2023_082981 [Brassica napus]